MDYHHVYCQGANVIFRDSNDYLKFMNAIAVTSYYSNVSILAFVVMSTHFHSVTYGKDMNTFKRLLGISYSSYFNSKYRHSGQVMSIFSREILDVYDLLDTSNYVLKNPVHHKIELSPFQYPYSTINCYFGEYYSSKERYKGDIHSCDIKTPSALSYKEKRLVLGEHILPDSYLIKDSMLILPESYIAISKMKGVYQNSYKTFLFNIMKNQTDNYEKKGGTTSYTTMESLSISAQKISDIEVCRIIDSLAKEYGVPSFLHFDALMLSKVKYHLQKLRADEAQIRRCLWIS